jgi:hypothetical protein
MTIALGMWDDGGDHFEYQFASIDDVPFNGHHHPGWMLLREMRESVRDTLRRDDQDH